VVYVTGSEAFRSACHPEGGREAAESKDPLTSPENAKNTRLSNFGGSLDSLRSLGITGFV